MASLSRPSRGRVPERSAGGKLSSNCLKPPRNDGCAYLHLQLEPVFDSFSLSNGEPTQSPKLRDWNFPAACEGVQATAKGLGTTRVAPR